MIRDVEDIAVAQRICTLRFSPLLLIPVTQRLACRSYNCSSGADYAMRKSRVRISLGILFGILVGQRDAPLDIPFSSVHFGDLVGWFVCFKLEITFFELVAAHDFVLQLLRQIGFMIDHKKPTRIEHEYVHRLHACMYSMTNPLLPSSRPCLSPPVRPDSQLCIFLAFTARESHRRVELPKADEFLPEASL